MVISQDPSEVKWNSKTVYFQNETAGWKGKIQLRERRESTLHAALYENITNTIYYSGAPNIKNIVENPLIKHRIVERIIKFSI